MHYLKSSRCIPAQEYENSLLNGQHNNHEANLSAIEVDIR